MKKTTRVSRPHRLAILTNDLPPYRVPVYRQLSDRFETQVLLGGREDNRKWHLETANAPFRVKRSWGFTLKRVKKSSGGKVMDFSYLQVNPGLLIDLIRFRPDALISTGMGFRSLIAQLFGTLYRKPVWIWWGGTLHTERDIPPVKHMLRKFFFAPYVRHWISYGATSTEYLESLGVSPSDVVQVQNSLNYDAFGNRAASPLNLELPHPRILFVGQLIGRKGIFELLHVLADMQASSIDCSLLIVGDGPERQSVVDTAESLSLKDIEILDYIPPEKMASVYHACDLLVFPTLEDVWGLVVNEALVCGLPVLVSMYAGCAPELAPPTMIFDPLNHADFQVKLEAAVAGRVAKVEGSPLWPEGMVADVIGSDVARVLNRDK